MKILRWWRARDLFGTQISVTIGGLKYLNILKILWYKHTLSEKCPYSEFFWSVYSCIWIEYEEILCISPYWLWIKEYTDQKNSEYGRFSRNDNLMTSSAIGSSPSSIKNIKRNYKITSKISFKPVSEEFVRDIVNNLSSNKAADGEISL